MGFGFWSKTLRGKFCSENSTPVSFARHRNGSTVYKIHRNFGHRYGNQKKKKTFERDETNTTQAEFRTKSLAGLYARIVWPFLKTVAFRIRLGNILCVFFGLRCV